MSIRTYLKQQMHVICLTLGYIAVFVLVLSLCRIPAKAMVYPAVLCLVMLSIYLGFDFVRQKQRLQDLQGALSGSEDILPEAQTVWEESYQAYITALRQQTGDLMMQQDVRYQDMIDYYTTWAHQIKTPISAMQLKLQNEDSALSRQLNSDLLRTQQYVDMVMVYLRLDAPSNDYVLKQYSIDDLVRRSVRAFASEFISRGLMLNYRKIEGSFITDEKWFCFVLEQILSNALKYTRSGSISIFMENGTLCIADTGIGIAPEDLPRIFEKGYTGFNGRADRHASGLGLYLCKRICDGLSIPIAAQSQPGQGTVLRLRLDQYHLKAE